MNKLEATVSLVIITFFAAIQYIFLSALPATVSHFAFLCITNLIGFLITLAFFFGELFRLDKKQIVQSMALAGELFVFNVFLLLGSSGVSATVCACVLSAYFVFIPLFITQNLCFPCINIPAASPQANLPVHKALKIGVIKK